MALGTTKYLGKNREIGVKDHGGVVCNFDDTTNDPVAIQNGSVPTAVSDYVTAVEYGDGRHHCTVLTIASLAISTTDNGTAGHAGGTKIYDFPKGYIQIDGGSQNITLMTADGTGIPNDAVLDIGVGSTVAATDVETLSGTNEDIINKDDITLSSALSAANQMVAEVTGGGIDGTSTAVDAYLNVAGTAATCDADGTLTISGTITIYWKNHGYGGTL